MKVAHSNLKMIASGANSEVYLYGTAEKSVVIKAVKTSCKNECRHLLNQYSILKGLNHDNIVKPLKYIERTSFNGTHGDKQTQTLKNILILERARHGNMLDFLKKKKLTLGNYRWLFAQICEAVQYLHSKNIAHRDLKLENILVSENKERVLIKIADFGFGFDISQTSHSNTYKGTKRGYMAPEIHSLLEDPNKEYEILKTDIFALGVILFSLIMKKLPFEYATPENTHYKLLMNEQYEQFWKHHFDAIKNIEEEEGSMISDFKDLFVSMTKYSPSERPTMKEILRSAWMKGRQSIIRAFNK